MVARRQSTPTLKHELFLSVDVYFRFILASNFINNGNILYANYVQFINILGGGIDFVIYIRS